MNPRLKQLHSELEALHAEATALAGLTSLSDEQAARADALPAAMEAKKEEILKAKRLVDTLAGSQQFLNGAGLSSVTGGLTDPEAAYAAAKRASVPRGRSKFFAQIEGYSAQEAAKAAYGFGHWMLASVTGNERSKRYCQENGIPITSAATIFAAGQSEGDSEKGAALVPPQYEADLIVLREKYGLFRQFARMTPMASDVLNRPRRKGGVTAYHVGGGQAITESDAQWDLVALVAKKIACLVRYESEISEDAVLSMGDLLAGEIAYAFAKQEDNDGFNGDGTSTYGGIMGVRERLKQVYGVVAGVGQVLGAGNNWSELTLANFQQVKGLLPQYAETPNTAWYCHKTFFENVMVPLALAAGGVTAAEIVAGVRRQFLGYDVRISQVMPSTEANSQIPIFFGDLELAAMFGDRRATTIAMSDQFLFNTDQLAIRGTERVDVNVHDVGDATNAGPVVGLITAAS